MNYTVLCITNCRHKRVEEFLQRHRQIADELDALYVVAYDRCDKPNVNADRFIEVECKTNIIENVLAEVHQECETSHVLRLDDDEIIDSECIQWIKENTELISKSNAVSFPRYNLWKDENTYIEELYPDVQIRLIRHDQEKRTTVHSSMNCDVSGGGHIHHFNFLVNSLQERVRKGHEYEKNRKGAGLGEEYRKYSTPERCIKMTLKPVC